MPCYHTMVFSSCHSTPCSVAKTCSQLYQNLLLNCAYLRHAFVPHIPSPDRVRRYVRVNPITLLPQISETQILAHAKYLSEDIGYRTVGTREHALGDAWMEKQAEELQRQCEEIIKARPDRKLQCETWRQEGSGSHRCVSYYPCSISSTPTCVVTRFDILGKRLYKTYRDLSNIIVRVSDGTEKGKEHAVLVNSHLDSTLPSPGAGTSHFESQRWGLA